MVLVRYAITLSEFLLVCFPKQLSFLDSCVSVSVSLPLSVSPRLLVFLCKLGEFCSLLRLPSSKNRCAMFPKNPFKGESSAIIWSLALVHLATSVEIKRFLLSCLLCSSGSCLCFSVAGLYPPAAGSVQSRTVTS